MRVVQSVRLFFQEGTSDKVYHAVMTEDAPGVFTVEVEWGRRGSTLNKGKKAVKVNETAARKVYQSLVREKMNKGYEEISDATAPQASAPPVGEGSGSRAKGVRKSVGVSAQLLNSVSEREVERLLADSVHVAQQKLDGNRVIVHVGPQFLATNRAGQATSIATSIFEGLSELPKGTIVDGEVVPTTSGAVYWLFDVLSLGQDDLRTKGYLSRWEVLADELEPGLSGPVKVIETAVQSNEKRALFERLMTAGAEGIVFKKRDAPYTSGRPASGGHQLKHKFIKSADVVIVENAGNAYRMVVRDGTKWREVGKVFAGTTNESRAFLDEQLAQGERIVAEVRYLYATDDRQLFQPVFIRSREDKTPEDCALDQLKTTNRDVHGVGE